MGKYILAFDAGTTSTRAIVFDKSGKNIGACQREFSQIYPKPGWVEHDPMEIWRAQSSVAKGALETAGISAGDIAAIGITNQRETTIVWDKNTGEPVYPAIVWQCRRTADYCSKLKRDGYEDKIREKTGLVIDAYFSATKLAWILDNVDGARNRAQNGELLFGTVDTWIIWKLTGGTVHITDYSNASRTMLYNINTLEWDREILELFNIPKSMLPTVANSSQIYGYTDLEMGETINIPIAGIAGDQQAALFGQGCFYPGMIKNTYGTGCFVLMNTGEKIIKSSNGLLTTIAWGIGDKVSYALEGSVFIAGASIQWLRDELKLLYDSPQSEYYADLAENTGGVYVVPSFTGLGAPYWDMYSRGGIFGITRGTKREHLVRATLESIAYQSKDVITAMEEDAGFALSNLRVDGGACANNFLMQFQADMLDVEVDRPVTLESTALGAAYLAGLAVGYWKSMEEIFSDMRIEKRFIPCMEKKIREKNYRYWRRAVERTMGWLDEEDT